jgi:DNA-binding NarL/FixJ family response regulator
MNYLIVIQDFTKGMELVDILEKDTCDSMIELASLGLLGYFLTGGNPDVLICNFNLGDIGCSGIDVARIVRKKNPDCIVIIMADGDLSNLGEIGYKQLPNNFNEEQVKAVIMEAVADMEILDFQALAGQR